MEATADYTTRRIQALEKELTNAKNHVRRLQIQISELKQRQRQTESKIRCRITEKFLEQVVDEVEAIPWM